jgi:hypothetical protein
MHRLNALFVCATLALSALFMAGCGGDGEPETIYEDLDAGRDTCTNSQVTCGDLSRIAYQVCTSEDETTCYLRRGGVGYDCAECGTIGGCFEATEQLVVEQCP